VTGPDGREWTIRVVRVRLPGWRPGSFDPSDESLGNPRMTLLLLPFAVVSWLVLPLLALLAALPFAFLRGVLSRRRWIEAETSRPTPELVRWRTTADRAQTAAAEIASALANGYDAKVADAELESITDAP
jgi:hypothetical protein